MKSVVILVGKQMDGYVFSISPATKESIKRLIPSAYPANRIFVAYDTKSDFEDHFGKIENHIFPLLLGVQNTEDLEKITEIEFIDPLSGEVLHKFNPAA
jgi:hypothetical protein